MIPVVSSRRLLVGRGNDGPGAPDVEVDLVVGVHGLVLSLSEARVRRVPVIHIISNAGVGHIVRVEAPRGVLQCQCHKQSLTMSLDTLVVAGTQQQPAAEQEAWSGAQSHLSMLSTWQ